MLAGVLEPGYGLFMLNPNDIPKQPQSQQSTQDQLVQLIVWANRLGLYDAADHIVQITSKNR